ncbi:aldehyde dehydrogenase family 9 member A1 [Paragonimus westermani]|uniref:Aldehyde dehydrogenase family 9 member A1 n=1 Tax=Paragonimus westermani TaxID=34504 RepID=A0A5J4NBV0_9TREM|nr:aldehyde dehydrogenase family 9 member A1 [Paragonimus westermani]
MIRVVQTVSHPLRLHLLNIRLMTSNSPKVTRTHALTRLREWLCSSTEIPVKLATEHSTLSPNLVSHDPATGQALVTFEEFNSEDVNSVVRSASAAQKVWCKIPPLERAKVLHNVAALIRAESKWLAELEALDTGKPLWEAQADIDACADVIVMFAGFVPTLTGVHVPVPPNPSRHVDMQLFIASSVGGGRSVLSTAASRIVPGTVELGGKSALIIMPDANLNEAIKGTLMANFYSQGQVCSNAGRVFVHKFIFDQFQSKLLTAVEKLRVGDPFDPNTSMGALITTEHKNKVISYIRSAVSEGAVLLCGGKQPAFPLDSDLNPANFLTPCVLTQCCDDMRAVREEIFGPVVTLLQFETEEEVIQRANNRYTFSRLLVLIIPLSHGAFATLLNGLTCSYAFHYDSSDLGLAGGVFSNDLSTAHRVASQLECGTVYVNSYNIYPPGIPFGGYKQSGFGRENSLETLLSYTQIKAVYVEGGPLPDPFPESVG